MKDFVDILTNRLLNVKNPRGSPPFMYMRFRQRLYSIPNTSRHIFAFSPRFDIANHLHQIPSDVDNMEKFMDFVSAMATAPFEQDKPLWEMHVRTDFGAEQSGILLFRYHQAITDGQSMVQILCRDLIDGGEQVYQQIKPRFGGLTYASHFCQAVFMAGYVFFTDFMSGGTADVNCLKYPEIQMSGRYEIFWSEPVNLSVLQRLKAITRTRFNDLLFTALAATLRTYCKMHGISTPADMTACFPVDLRSAKGESLADITLGNRYVLGKIRLPVSQEAGMPQLWRVRDQTQKLRSSYRHVAYDFLLKILGKAISHRALQSIWYRHYSGCTLFINSLAAPEGEFTIQKFGLEQLLMWIPPPFGMKIPLAINVITCLDQVQLVVVADTGAMKDAYWLAMDFPHEVLALGNLLKTRRAPETSKGGDDGNGESSEDAVQQSLHVLQERLVKIHKTLRHMRKKRDIGKVPALWNEFHLEGHESANSMEDGDDESGSSGSESDSESSDGSGSSSTGETSSTGRTTERSMPSKKTKKGNDLKVAAQKPVSPVNVSDVPEKTGKAMERRMSNKPMMFSAPRLSKPNAVSGDDEPVVAIAEKPKSLSLQRNKPLMGMPRTVQVEPIAETGATSTFTRPSSLPRSSAPGAGSGQRVMGQVRPGAISSVPKRA